MKIKSIEVFHIVMELKSKFETSFGATKKRPALILKVTSDSDITGWSEVVAGEGPWYSYETIDTALHVIRDYIIPLIRGKEFNTPEEYIRRVSIIRGHNMAKAGIDMALWDIHAKELNKPLYKVLGGVRDKIESGVSIGIKSSIDELIKTIEYYLDQGYRRIKIKIKPGWDVDVVDVIRKRLGDIPLQVDANAAYTLNDLPLLKRLDKYNLLMIEQPLHYDDLVEHSILQKYLNTPICLDESIKSLNDARAAYRLGSCMIINLKPGRVSGITESLRIHDFTSMTGIPIWIGGMLETGVGRAYLVSLATLPNVKYPNDISASNRYYEEDVVDPPWTIDDSGYMHTIDKPGIGVEVLEDKLMKYLVRKYVFKLD